MHPENTHICLFNSHKAWGGGENWHLRMATLLNEAGYRVTLFARKGSPLELRAKGRGFLVIPVIITNLSFLNLPKMIRLSLRFRKLRIHAIILNQSSDVKIAGVAARLARTRHIIYRRGIPLRVRNNAFNRLLFNKVLTRMVVNSKAIAQSLYDSGPGLLQPQKISVLYNSVKLNDTVVEVRSAHYFGPVLIGTAGRFSPEKGQEKLIRAAAIMAGYQVNFQLLLAGEGPTENELRKLVYQLNLQQVVTFEGFVLNPEEFYRRLHIFALPSGFEGCSNAILEAMNHGLPVVAFKNSSIPELVEDGVTGLLAENGSIADLAAKLTTLAEDAGRCKEMGMAAHKRIAGEFSDKLALQKLIDLIRD